MSDESNIINQINATASGQGQASAPPAMPTGPVSGWAKAFSPDPNAAAGAAIANGAQNVATAGSQMLSAAKSGQFSIEPGYAQQLINGLNNEIANLNGLYRHIVNIERQPPLGETPAALKVAPFYSTQVASGGPHSFVPNHQLIIQGLTDMVQAIQTAMNNYHQADDGNATQIKNAN